MSWSIPKKIHPNKEEARLAIEDARHNSGSHMPTTVPAALRAAVDALPDDCAVQLEAYGHTDAEGCTPRRGNIFIKVDTVHGA